MLKRMAMFLTTFGKRISPVWFYCWNLQGNSEMTSELLVINIYELSFRTAFSFSSFFWKLKIISIRNYNQHFTFKKAWDKFCKNFINYNLGLRIENKFTKFSKISFSMKCFTADFLQFFTKKLQNLAFGWTAMNSLSNLSISGIFLSFPNFLRS